MIFYLILEFGGRIDVKTLQDFIDNGAGNVLITGSTNIGDAIRELGILFLSNVFD